MKKLLIGIVTVVFVLLLAYGVTYGLASKAESKAERAFAAMAPGAMETGYPPVSAKNDSAVRLEQLAIPLEIDIRPRDEEASDRPELDGTLRASMSDWLRAQQERPDDAVDPIPSDIKTWLDANSASVDAMASFLASADTPRWPMLEGSRADQPLPNLLGHMTLFRVLNVAALERASHGDQAAAWELLHAASTLSRGIRERRELISQLIAVAGVRMIAATARKLEPPVPAWFAELSEPRLYDSMFDAIRFETAWSAAAVKDPGWDPFEGTTKKAGLLDAAGARVMQPLIRWSLAEHHRAMGEELAQLQAADPCGIDTSKVNGRMEARASSFPPDFAAGIAPNFANALSRAASAEVALEGTSRILALKAARNADPQHAWPASFASESSLCKGAQWAYERSPDGAASLRFTGHVDIPPGSPGTKVPLEYRGSPAGSKVVSGS